jgi:SAM-dependent methyltransferase
MLMAAYREFARYYDAVNGDPVETSLKILSHIGRYRPQADSVLELGCGTGAVLAGLGSGLRLTGVDLSPEMLEIAARRCPDAHLHLDDMTTFTLPEQFDVVLCVFDTLNHVHTFDGWLAMFERVATHLVDGGLFIFDINTVGRFQRLAEMAPWVHDFEGHTLIMNVEFDDGVHSEWDIRVFEHRDNKNFVLHHEVIVELGVTLQQVRKKLDHDFEPLEETDRSGAVPTDDSDRAYFVYQRRARATAPHS